MSRVKNIRKSSSNETQPVEEEEEEEDEDSAISELSDETEESTESEEENEFELDYAGLQNKEDYGDTELDKPASQLSISNTK